MAKKNITVAITGAAGQIGYAFLFRLASGQVFGPDVSLNLHLIEVEAGLPSLEGVVMELDDCAFPLLKDIKITSDLKTGFSDINWGVLIGAAPRKQGMERSDLLKINGGIFTQQGKAINDYAADDVRIFVVGNPCNTNALIAMNNAPDVPKDRFFAMTMLDENRSRHQLAVKAGVDIREVTNMTIWGNHSSTQYPDFANAKISGKPATDVIHDRHWLETDFVQTIQQRGAAVIKARGASSAASAANAALDSVYKLTHDTPKGDTFSVALHSEGQYGVDEGLIFSMPCSVKNGVLEVVEGLEQDAFGRDKFEITLNELRGERDAVKAMGLIS